MIDNHTIKVCDEFRRKKNKKTKTDSGRKRWSASEEKFSWEPKVMPSQCFLSFLQRPLEQVIVRLKSKHPASFGWKKKKVEDMSD